MKVYNPSLEERAFLYQEAQALESMSKELGSLSVLVEEVTSKPNQKKASNRYRVTFLVAPESVGVRVQATSANIFDAAIAAKEEAVRQLSAILNALPRSARSREKKIRIQPEKLH